LKGEERIWEMGFGIWDLVGNEFEKRLKYKGMS